MLGSKRAIRWQGRLCDMHKIEITDMQLDIILLSLEKVMGVYHLKAEDEEKKKEKGNAVNVAEAYHTLIRMQEETILALTAQTRAA